MECICATSSPNLSPIQGAWLCTVAARGAETPVLCWDWAVSTWSWWYTSNFLSVLYKLPIFPSILINVDTSLSCLSAVAVLFCCTCLSQDGSHFFVVGYAAILNFFLFPFVCIIPEIIFLRWFPVQFSLSLPADPAVIFNLYIPICFCKHLILSSHSLWSGPFWALPHSRVVHCTIYIYPLSFAVSLSFSKLICFSNCHCISLLPSWATRWYSFSKDNLF